MSTARGEKRVVGVVARRVAPCVCVTHAVRLERHAHRGAASEAAMRKDLLACHRVGVRVHLLSVDPLDDARRVAFRDDPGKKEEDTTNDRRRR